MENPRIPFTREDEEKIASAALWGTIAAVTSIGSFALESGITLFTAKNTQALMGAFFQLSVVGTLTIVLAIWMIQACAAFRKVATTDVADERFLLLGFAKLRNYFKLIGILIIVGVCAGTFLLMASLMCHLAFK